MLKNRKEDRKIMIEAKNLVKKYDYKGSQVTILEDVSIRIEDSEFISIVGESGAGKTTMLNMMSTIDNVTEGSIEYNGKRIDNISPKKAAELRINEFGFIFQDYLLIESLNVKDNILLPAVLSGKKIETDFYNELIDILALNDKEKNMTNKLSGGERQRVAIARSLINNPKIIFADEPTGNLDEKNSLIVFDMLSECRARFNQTIILVTHDIKLANKTNRIFEVRNKKIYEK